jgi:hypothetical protein
MLCHTDSNHEDEDSVLTPAPVARLQAAYLVYITIDARPVCLAHLRVAIPTLVALVALTTGGNRAAKRTDPTVKSSPVHRRG